MQGINNQSSSNIFMKTNYTSNKDTAVSEKANVSDVQNTNSSNTESSIVMSLEEIQKYLEDSGIEDDTGTRAKDLYSLQEFIGKVDDETYTRMFDALNVEKNTSYASMRYSSFPNSDMLDENPRMFHAIIETTLAMEDTTHALIFTLDLKAVLSKQRQDNTSMGKSASSKPPSLDLDVDFDMMTLMGFLKKKMEELEESAKDGLDISEKNFINDYTALLENYKNVDMSTIYPAVNLSI